MKKRVLTSVLVAMLLVVATLLTSCGNTLKYTKEEIAKYLQIGDTDYKGKDLEITLPEKLKAPVDKDVDDAVKAILYANKKEVKDQKKDEVFKNDAIGAYDDVKLYFSVYDKDGKILEMNKNKMQNLFPEFKTSLKVAEPTNVHVGAAREDFWDLVNDFLAGKKPSELNATLTPIAEKAEVKSGNLVYIKYIRSYTAAGVEKEEKAQYIGIDLGRAAALEDKDKSLGKLIANHLATEGHTALTVDKLGETYITLKQKEVVEKEEIDVNYKICAMWAAEDNAYSFEYTFKEDYEIKELRNEKVTVEIYFEKDGLTHFELPITETTKDEDKVKFVKDTMVAELKKLISNAEKQYDVEDLGVEVNVEGTTYDAALGQFKVAYKNYLQAIYEQNKLGYKMRALWKEIMKTVKDPDWSNEVLKKTLDAYMDEWKHNMSEAYHYYKSTTTSSTVKTKLEYMCGEAKVDVSEAALNAWLLKEARENVKEKLVLYAIAYKENLVPTDSEYHEFLNRKYETYKNQMKALYEQYGMAFNEAAFTYESFISSYEYGAKGFGEEAMKMGHLWDLVVEKLVKDASYNNSFKEVAPEESK